ncbi:MAG: hypothetical protein JSU96_13595 [Acidobacteriota bacterium]|nr:MAG: hypothetical protein JSU96_13595 [Acidobacteriota bacterium]
MQVGEKGSDKSMEPDRGGEPSLVERVRGDLEPFVFFHLGADARLDVNWSEEQVAVEIEHSRIRPIQFRLTSAQIEAFGGDFEAFEQFMLEQLTRHRIHR